MEVSGQFNPPVALAPLKEAPSIHQASAYGKEGTLLPLAGLELRFLGDPANSQVTVLTELFWLPMSNIKMFRFFGIPL
jgi:hypothetical protein